MSDCSPAQFSCERQFVSSDRQHVVVVGEIDLAAGPRLSGVLREAQTYARHVLLDLSQTTFIDASGLRILLAARAQARATAATFAITGSTSPVRRLLELASVDDLIADSPFPPSERERVTVRAPTPPHRPAIGRPRSFAVRGRDGRTSGRL